MVVLTGTSNPKLISGWTGQQIPMSAISGSTTFPVSGMNSPRISSNNLPLFQRLQRSRLWVALNSPELQKHRRPEAIPSKEPEHHGCCIQETNLPLSPKGFPLSLIVSFPKNARQCRWWQRRSLWPHGFLALLTMVLGSMCLVCFHAPSFRGTQHTGWQKDRPL